MDLRIAGPHAKVFVKQAKYLARAEDQLLKESAI